MSDFWAYVMNHAALPLQGMNAESTVGALLQQMLHIRCIGFIVSIPLSAVCYPVHVSKLRVSHVRNKCPAYRCSSLGDMQQMMTGVKAFQAGLPHSSGASLGTSQSLARLRHPQQQLPTPHAGHAELIDGTPLH